MAKASVAASSDPSKATATAELGAAWLLRRPPGAMPPPRRRLRVATAMATATVETEAMVSRW
jgi:hypothetical protein